MPELTARSHAARRTRIGASEVGALLDLHPYQSPARIYARIVDGDTVPQTVAMSIGKGLEAAARRLAAAQIGLKVHACSRTYIDPMLPLAATPDAYARRDPLRPDLDVPDGLGLLELKISGDYSLWTDLPPFVEWQVRAQLSLTDRDWAYVAAIVGTSLRVYLVERDLSRERDMLDAVDRFDRLHLTPRVPPPPDTEELILRWGLRDGETLALGDEPVAVIGDVYADRVRDRRAADRDEKAARSAFVDAIAAEGSRLVIGSGWRATTDERGSLRFDVRR